MTRCLRVFATAVLWAPVSLGAVGVPDTGQDLCYNGTAIDGVSASSATSVARDAGSYPRQDCRYGRDAAAAAGMLVKSGAGAKGFDYTKIANDGSALAAGAVLGTGSGDWACTRDNITGLTWEVKTTTNTDLRYSGHSYAWYNTDATTNGGAPGSPGGNTCNSTLSTINCNSQAYTVAVNAAALCSYTDWRMPTLREFLSLVYLDGTNPSIDPTYFPNTPGLGYWTGSTNVVSPSNGWGMSFNVGYTYYADKTSPYYLRLVRGGPF